MVSFEVGAGVPHGEGFAFMVDAAPKEPLEGNEGVVLEPKPGCGIPLGLLLDWPKDENGDGFFSSLPPTLAKGDAAGWVLPKLEKGDDELGLISLPGAAKAGVVESAFAATAAKPEDAVAAAPPNGVDCCPKVVPLVDLALEGVPHGEELLPSPLAAPKPPLDALGPPI